MQQLGRIYRISEGGVLTKHLHASKKSDNCNEYAKHTWLGGLGACPPKENFTKFSVATEIEFGSIILSENNITLFIPIFHHSLYINIAKGHSQ